jgi:hypothetical protein
MIKGRRQLRFRVSWLQESVNGERRSSSQLVGLWGPKLSDFWITGRSVVHVGRIVLLLLLAAGLVGLTTGCPRPNPRAKKKPFVRAPHRPERGPHGSPLAYWTDECLLEVCIDRAAKEAIVYVLKANDVDPEPIEASELTLTLTNSEPPVEIRLRADPQEEDPKGSSSRFRASDPVFAAEGAFYGLVAGKLKAGDEELLGEFDERARSAAPISKHKK